MADLNSKVLSQQYVNTVYLPLESTSFTISWTSPFFGFCPNFFMTASISSTSTVPDPSVSKRLKASLNSKKRKKESNKYARIFRKFYLGVNIAIQISNNYSSVIKIYSKYGQERISSNIGRSAEKLHQQ